MNILRLYIITIHIIILSCFNVHGQELQLQIQKGFQTGNVNVLSAHFNERFQLTILDSDYRLSKAQGTEIMRDFFKKYPPVSYTVLFKGDKKDSNFTVGKLVTRSDVFRITIFFGKTDSKNLIHLLEIEKENESEF